MSIRLLSQARRQSRGLAPTFTGYSHCRRQLCTQSEAEKRKPWEAPMSSEDFAFMRSVLAAPSPVGLEAAMTKGVLKPKFLEFMPTSWKLHEFVGNAGIVCDTMPNNPDALTCMIVGHADKIRMQVRSIDSSGKVYIDTDSFLPLTLLGNPVKIFSEDASKPGEYRVINGGTVEGLGAIHFADAGLRAGTKGLKKEQVYVELQLTGKDKQKQVVEGLGLRPGDTILLDRPISRGFKDDSFQGAYLDNGLGCFVAAKLAEMVGATPLEHVRCLFAIATHEEIGRFGSRVLSGQLKPDILIAVDVNHDYVNAPNIQSKRFQPIEMGKGPSFSIGSITSTFVNTTLQKVALENDIPLQPDVVGRDTGTDAMAAVFSNMDVAAGSVGIPVRNMHTISETGSTQDVQAAVHLLHNLLKQFDHDKVTRQCIIDSHPNLSEATELSELKEGWDVSSDDTSKSE